jgi:hypothetical protein
MNLLISLLPCLCGWLGAVIATLNSEVLQVNIRWKFLHIEYWEVNISSIPTQLCNNFSPASAQYIVALVAYMHLHLYILHLLPCMIICTFISLWSVTNFSPTKQIMEANVLSTSAHHLSLECEASEKNIQENNQCWQIRTIIVERSHLAQLYR